MLSALDPTLLTEASCMGLACSPDMMTQSLVIRPQCVLHINRKFRALNVLVVCPVLAALGCIVARVTEVGFSG